MLLPSIGKRPNEGGFGERRTVRRTSDMLLHFRRQISARGARGLFRREPKEKEGEGRGQHIRSLVHTIDPR